MNPIELCQLESTKREIFGVIKYHIWQRSCPGSSNWSCGRFVQKRRKRKIPVAQQCRFILLPINIHVKAKCVYIWSPLLAICQQQMWFIECPPQSKSSVVVSSSSSPTSGGLCAHLCGCALTQSCDLIKYKKPSTNDWEPMWLKFTFSGSGSAQTLMWLPIKAGISSYTNCWPVPEWILRLSAVSRQKKCGLLQFLPLALLTLPSMPRVTEKAEGLCWLGLHGLSEAFWVLWQSSFLVIPSHGITHCSQVLKQAGLGPYQWGCHHTEGTGELAVTMAGHCVLWWGHSEGSPVLGDQSSPGHTLPHLRRWGQGAAGAFSTMWSSGPGSLPGTLH